MNSAARDERAVDGHLTRVVGDEEDAPRGHVLDAVHLGAEVLAVERGDRQDDVLRPLGVEAERVDAGRAERQRHPRHAVGEGLAEQPLERVVDRVARPPQESRQERPARRARRGRCERVRDAAARDAGGLWGTVGDRGSETRAPLWTSRGRRSTALCSARECIDAATPRDPAAARARATSWSSSRRRARFRATSSGAAWPGFAIALSHPHRAGRSRRETDTSPAATRGGARSSSGRCAIRRRRPSSPRAGVRRAAHRWTTLPWGELVRRPKWLVGFSDVTALHAMAWRAGVASVHGPNVTGLGLAASPARPRARGLRRSSGPRRRASGAGSAVLLRRARRGGRSSAGNLAIVHAMAAAGRLVVPEGAVLALEDVTEAPYRVDRMLTSLHARRAPRRVSRDRLRRLRAVRRRVRTGARSTTCSQSEPGRWAFPCSRAPRSVTARTTRPSSSALAALVRDDEVHLRDVKPRSRARRSAAAREGRGDRCASWAAGSGPARVPARRLRPSTSSVRSSASTISASSSAGRLTGRRRRR